MTQIERRESVAYEMGYRVNEQGDVYNPKGLKMKISSPGNKRYPQFNIKYNGKKFGVRMHRLAAYCFYGDSMYEDGIVVRHLNGDKVDVSKDNIALGTQKDNMADISEETLRKANERRRKFNLANDVTPPKVFKIPDSEVPEILARLDAGETQRAIAAEMGLHHSTIGYIHTNRRFTYEENKCS